VTLLPRYRLQVQDQDVTDLVDQLTWEENTLEIAARCMFTIGLHPAAATDIVRLCATGAYVRVSADGQAVFEGKVTEFDFEESARRRALSCTAYDGLWGLTKDRDDLYMTDGVYATQFVDAVCRRFGIALVRNDLADVQLGLHYFRNQTPAEMLTWVLARATLGNGGGVPMTFLRWADGGLQIVGAGGNAALLFDVDTVEDLHDHWDINDLVTAVRIVGVTQNVQTADGGRIVGFEVREATNPNPPPGDFGRLREVVYEDDFGGTGEFLDKAVAQIFAMRGQPHRVQRVTAPDVPALRKGEGHLFHVGTLTDMGDATKARSFVVTGVHHDAARGKMVLDIDSSGFLGRNMPLVVPNAPLPQRVSTPGQDGPDTTTPPPEDS
jgi:hypothetical protein